MEKRQHKYGKQLQMTKKKRTDSKKLLKGGVRLEHRYQSE